MKVWIVFFALLIALISCSEKQNVYQIITNDKEIVYLNKNIPANPSLDVKLNELFEITQLDSNLQELGLNPKSFFGFTANEKFLFVITKDNKGLIYRYDNRGNFLSSFSKTGNGPGESSGYEKLIISKDILLAISTRDFKVNKFNLNGNFIAALNLDRFYESIIKLADDKFLGFSWNEKIVGENNYEVTMEIVLLDNNFKQTKLILSREIKHEGITAVTSRYYPYICNNNSEIFISWLSENDYDILVYDIFTGEYKFTIKNNFRSKYYSNSEMDWLSKFNNIDMQKLFGSKLKKKAINTICCDKNGNLWVLATKDREDSEKNVLKADIFYKGVFQNTVHVKEIEYHDFSAAFRIFKLVFENNRIYYHNFGKYDDEKGGVIKVFDYNWQ